MFFLQLFFLAKFLLKLWWSILFSEAGNEKLLQGRSSMAKLNVSLVKKLRCPFNVDGDTWEHFFSSYAKVTECMKIHLYLNYMIQESITKSCRFWIFTYPHACVFRCNFTFLFVNLFSITKFNWYVQSLVCSWWSVIHFLDWCT